MGSDTPWTDGPVNFVIILVVAWYSWEDLSRYVLLDNNFPPLEAIAVRIEKARTALTRYTETVLGKTLKSHAHGREVVQGAKNKLAHMIDLTKNVDQFNKLWTHGTEMKNLDNLKEASGLCEAFQRGGTFTSVCPQQEVWTFVSMILHWFLYYADRPSNEIEWATADSTIDLLAFVATRDESQFRIIVAYEDLQLYCDIFKDAHAFLQLRKFFFQRANDSDPR